MSVTLAKMTSDVRAAISISERSIEEEAIHRAIQAAGEHYHAEVKPASIATSITVGSGLDTINVQSSITGFVRHDLFGQEAYIDNNPVKLIGYQKIARRLAGSPAAGRPTKMAFLADNALYFDKATDQAYTLVLPHVARLTSFTPGSPSSVTLNIPTVDAARLAYTGCVYYLLKGLYDEAQEVQNAKAGFDQLIAEAKKRFPDTDSAIRDRQVKT